MLSIKNATVADIPLIRELTMQVWPQTYTPILGPVQVAYMLDTMYNVRELQQQMGQGHRYILCYDDDMPVAFASYSSINAYTYKLNKLYALPHLQGKGIGRYIIDHITATIKETGATALQLNVNRYNKAHSFYQKLGFQQIAVEDIDIGGGYFMNDYVMELQIV